MDLGLPERATGVAQGRAPNPVPRALRDVARAGDLLRSLALEVDLGVATDPLHLLRPEPDVCLVDEEPGLRPVHLDQLSDELPVALQALRVHALEEKQGRLEDRPSLPPEVEVGGPGSSTLFQVPVSTWYENDTMVSFLNALLP